MTYNLLNYRLTTSYCTGANNSASAKEGYLKTIPMKEAWANAWNNWTDENKKVFTSLPNFDAAIFEKITGIKVTDAKRTKKK